MRIPCWPTLSLSTHPPGIYRQRWWCLISGKSRELCDFGPTFRKTPCCWCQVPSAELTTFRLSPDQCQRSSAAARFWLGRLCYLSVRYKGSHHNSRQSIIRIVSTSLAQFLDLPLQQVRRLRAYINMSTTTTETRVEASDSYERFISELDGTHTLPLWQQMAKLNPSEPNPKTIPHIWRYDELRPYLLRAGDLVTEKQAERRVLMLVNPGRGTFG